MSSLNTTIPVRKEIKDKIEKHYKNRYENWNSWLVRVMKLMDENKMRERLNENKKK